MIFNSRSKSLTVGFARAAASISFLSLAVLLAGCPSKSSSPSSPNNAPTATNTPVTSTTPTSTATQTATSTPTATFANTATKTPTLTPSSTSTATATNSSTNTVTLTPTLTGTNTASSTPTQTGTNSPTPTITQTPTLTPTNTSTRTPTVTGTPTSTPTSTATTCSNHGITSQIGAGSFSTDYYYSDQVGLGQSTYVTSFTVYCQDNSSTGESAYIALYDASSGTLETSATFSVKLSDGTSYKTVSITPVTLPAATYNLVILVPTGTNSLDVGQSGTDVNFEYGTYAGGAPPANYSTLAATNLTGGFESVTGQTFYFTGCP